MAKYNIYAVAFGKDPRNEKSVHGLKFRTWDECKPYVKGVEGAKYKGFLTEDEANAWLEKQATEALDDKPEKDPSPEIKEQKAWQEMADQAYQVKLHPIDQNFMITCQELGISQMNTEHLLKKMFVDVVQYLKNNGCINELPFK